MEKTDSWMVMLGISILIISLVGSAVGGRPESPAATSVDGGGTFQLKTVSQTITGTGSENSQKEQSTPVCVTNLVSFSVKLTWQDEPISRPLLTNEPDELGVTVESPVGEAKSQKQTASTGSVGVDYSYPVTAETAARKASKAGMGPWTVAVEVGNCGDQEPLVPDPGGLRTVEDTGNAYTLEITYTYFEKVKGA